MSEKRYLQLLSEKYPTIQSVCTEIINLNAILNLPKGTEHFMSDLHGEYEAFCHLLNNCAGEVRDKVDRMFSDIMTKEERKEICTLIYYPKEKMNLLRQEDKLTDGWYRDNLKKLINIAKKFSSKYTRSKVRKAMPQDYRYIIDELLHMQEDEDNNQIVYHEKILDTIISIKNAEEFIEALSTLIKRLAVDHLHIVGDVFDRGEHPDDILDLLMEHHSIDIQWGNHDILWMGATAGSDACIATTIRNNIQYNNMQMLENGYGISLRTLTLFAERLYPDMEPMKAALKAISVILFKLEGQIISRHPEYNMDDRRLLHKINYENGTIQIEGKTYEMNDVNFPTVDRENPYELSSEEKQLVKELRRMYVNNKRLKQHIEFLYAKGSMYCCFNNNLLYHGCVPLDEDGNFAVIKLNDKNYKGKDYLDYADKMARKAYFNKNNQDELDFMWYLWCGEKSPLSGRKIKTFERTFIDDKNAWNEPKNPYYDFYKDEKTCNMILHDFDMYSPMSHIINGHTPIRVTKGEKPVHANGKLIIIDGGFCKAYHDTTGIAGYTLIYNSHSMRLMSHQPFESIETALEENKDIESTADRIETIDKRVMVRDSDIGKNIKKQIKELEELLEGYRQGEIKERV